MIYFLMFNTVNIRKLNTNVEFMFPDNSVILSYKSIGDQMHKRKS